MAFSDQRFQIYIIFLTALPQEMQFPAPPQAPGLTLIAERNRGAPRPVRPALSPPAAPQHVARVALKRCLAPEGILGVLHVDLLPVADGGVRTLHH